MRRSNRGTFEVILRLAVDAAHHSVYETGLTIRSAGKTMTHAINELYLSANAICTLLWSSIPRHPASTGSCLRSVPMWDGSAWSVQTVAGNVWPDSTRGWVE